MKHIYTLLLLIFSFSGFSQDIINDTFTMEPGYANMVFYNMSEGVVGTAPLADWHVAFDVSPMGSSIRINGGMGINLYEYGPAEEWDNVDVMSWMPGDALYNDQTSWSASAFNQNGDGGFDLGWGDYNVVTHVVTGDKVYLLQTLEGDLFKVQPQSLASGVYTFRSAPADGGDETVISVDKDDFEGNHFAYYALGESAAVDLEPNSAWDFLFTRYIEDLGDQYYYGVAGALMSRGTSVQQLDGLDDPYVDGEIDPDAAVTVTNEVGHDWKEYQFGVGYSIANDRCYIVNSVSGEQWRMVFTGFGGTTDGLVELGKVLEATPSDVGSIAPMAAQVYPNPARTGQAIQLDWTGDHPQTISIVDAMGRTIQAPHLANKGGVIAEGLPPGWYRVLVTSQHSTQSVSLIVQ